ncbi:zinc finger protein 236 isoform X3 [Magallana gigas]|uniref:zinc finger protein 236 isoform X3 n=1 Tax=Magallana gigas TaxID=29159 RepID=UPI003341E572
MISYHKIYMSPVQSSNLQSQLCALWKKQKFCDAVIKSDNISVMAHSLVLAASCPKLQSMEAYSFGSLLEIRVDSDITKESVMAFLQYLYEGYLMLTEENYCHVEKLAHSMHIDSIISYCKDFNQSILSSRSDIHETTDQADFKHVRTTNLLRVLDSSQKRLHESSVNGDSSKRLKQSSSNHCSNESISVKQESPLGVTQSQGGGIGGTELKQGPSASNQSESYLTSSNKVSLNINSEKAAASGDGVIFYSNPNFKEGSSTSLNSTGPPHVQVSGCGSQLNGSPLPLTISNVHSLQTVQSSNFELGKKTPQTEPYPVLLKEVRQSSSPFSCNLAKVSASCAGIDKDDKRPISSQSLSLQQQFKKSSRKFREKSESQTCTSTSNSVPSTDPSTEVSLSIVKIEPEDSIIQTDEGMFLSTAQRDETQTSQSSWLHDNPSMSSEENLSQEETSSSLTSRTDENRDQVTIENGSNLESGSFVDEKSLLEISCGETGAMANLFSEIDRQTEIAVQAIMAGDSKVEPASRSQIINCTVCDKTFSTTYGHKMHMERFHPETLTKKSKKKYPKCKTCGKQMASKYALSIHEIKHTKAKYFKCKQCGAQFGYKHVLNSHMEVCSRAKTSKR